MAEGGLKFSVSEDFADGSWFAVKGVAFGFW
jgi:hypothetical protein